MLTAMATAFNDDGAVDLDGTAAVAAHLVDHGNDGVVVSGTTGESPTTCVRETGDILRAVKDAVGDRATVIAGVGTNATAHSIELARQAEKLGADGVLLVTPYYNKPGQAGLRHHFHHVVAATDTPGDALRRTGPHRHPDRASTPTRRSRATPSSRSRTPSATTPAASSSSRWATRSTPATTTPTSASSPTARAAWSPSSPTPPATSSRDDRRLGRGDTAAALKTYTTAPAGHAAIMGVPNYGATTAKAALELLGVLDNRRVRGPLVPLADDEVAALRAGLAASDLL